MTASRDPNPSRCAGPMFVITPISGEQISPRRFISPGLFMPSSSTAHLWSKLRFSRVRGSPMWLFKFPQVDSVENCLETTPAVILRVLVLPFEPVMATTAAFERFRLNAARLPNALMVSFTVIQTIPFFVDSLPGSVWVLVLSIKRPLIPRSITLPVKL